MPGIGRKRREERPISFLKALRAGTRASQFATQLRDRFARQPRWKACADAQSYYRAFLEDFPGRALIDHRGPYVGDELPQDEIINSMLAGRKLFLVSAPPGCGKSRFALELARRLGRAQKSWEVRFVLHNESALRQELHELTQAKQLVLIVDDAHDCPALVQLLASACSIAEPQSHLYLVCLTRPAGRAALTEALAHGSSDRAASEGIPSGDGEPLEIDLGRPNAKLTRELIDKLIPQLSPHHRDVVRRFVTDSFFAAVLLCTSVARQKTLPQTLSAKNLRDYAVRQPITQATQDLCPPEKAFRALGVYAACAPVRLGDTAIRASAAALSALSVSEIETLERRVLETGLFQVDANESIRPVPDLVGDLILEEICLNEQGRPTPYAQSLLQALFDSHPGPIIRNCTDIGRLFATATRVDLVSEQVLARAEALSAQAQPEVLAVLDSCATLAARNPATVVRLVDVLTKKGILRADPPARELSPTGSLEVSAQLLLTTASEQDPTVVPKAMEYSRRLLACARTEARNYQSLLNSLASSCQFAVARPLGHATAVLDFLNGWVAGSDVEAAALAALLARGFLRLRVRADLWARNAPTPVLVSVSPSEEIFKLRDRALDILVRGSRHSAPAVQYAAAESLADWAHGYGDLTAELRERCAPQLNRELGVLAENFSKLGATTAHLPVRATVEHRAWRWWTEDLGLLMQRAGARILGALPDDKTYSLWKALHDDALPVFPLPLDETSEPQLRRESHLALPELAAERIAELAKELFDKLDAICLDSPAWSALFTSVLSASPQQKLQRRARLYVAEFVRRHPAEAWAFVTEDSAHGPLGRILPELLEELRGQDSPRWQEAMQRSQPGTRLFELELRALCGAGELDSAERSLVSKGLDLEDAGVVHLSAQALLKATPSALAPGLTAVFAVLRTRPADERLWELTLDAFARWGDHVLSAPEGEEAGPGMRAISSELLMLLRAHGKSLSWGEGPHTRRLATAVAILAVAIPHTLKSWMRELWSPSADPTRDGELPLSSARLSRVLQLVAKSPTASYWQKQFAQWMTDEPELARAGARGLVELCGLTHPCVMPMIARIAQQPTSASLEALGEFVRSYSSSPQFIEDALTLLRHCVDCPEEYGVLEKAIIFAASRASSGRDATLQAIEKSLQNGALPPALRETLARAKQAIQGAAAEELLDT